MYIFPISWFPSHLLHHLYPSTACFRYPAMYPPEVDQTTSSPQRWQIEAPELRQKFQIATVEPKEASWPHKVQYARRALQESFFNPDTAWDAMSKLARPVPAARIKQSPAHRRSATSALNALSVELLDMVLDYLAPEALMALALTCESMWDLALGRIHASYITSPHRG